MQQKTLLRIIEVIREYTLIKNVTDYQLRRRYQEIVVTRQLACYFIKKLTDMSNQQIGRLIGNVDHSTVTHSIKVINTLMDTNQDPLYKKGNFRARVNDMEIKIIDILAGNIKEHQRYMTRKEFKYEAHYKSIIMDQNIKLIALQNELDSSNNMIKLLQAKLNRLEHPYMTA